jgi:hypothetical protein
MCPAPAIILESHRSAATLYISGELTPARVFEALERAHELPEHVRGLRIDLRGAHRGESDALSALERGLRRWRGSRRGMTRVKLAPVMETSAIAIRYVHRRWSPSMGHRIRPPRDAGDFRFRDHREAVVTRSLRERAGSETQ